MILTRYIFKDILKVQVVCFVVLFMVFLCQTVIKMLGQASSGSVPVNIVSELVLYSMPSVGFILLPMTLYVGIIVSLSRMSSDSEMVVMKSIGISGATFMKIGMLLAFITSILTAVNCLYLMPKATYEQKVLSNNTQNNPSYMPIESGKFSDFGDYTIYIQTVNGGDKKDKSLEQVVVIKNLNSVVAQNKETVFNVAKKGSIRTDEDGVRWLTLGEGNLYQPSGKDSSLKKTSYDTLSIPVPSDKNNALLKPDVLQGISTSDLIASEKVKAKVELQWRIAPVLGCFIFSLLAIPLSMINPRQGKFARLGPAILLFVSYYLALLSIRNLLNSEKIPLYPGMYIVPVIYLLFVAVPLNIDMKKRVKRKKTNIVVKTEKN